MIASWWVRLLEQQSSEAVKPLRGKSVVLHVVGSRSEGWHVGAQVEVWESITKALATLGPVAELEGDKQEDSMDEEQLVEYEGMLVAASAAQRRR